MNKCITGILHFDNPTDIDSLLGGELDNVGTSWQVFHIECFGTHLGYFALGHQLPLQARNGALPSRRCIYRNLIPGWARVGTHWGSFFGTGASHYTDGIDKAWLNGHLAKGGQGSVGDDDRVEVKINASIVAYLRAQGCIAL